MNTEEHGSPDLRLSVFLCGFILACSLIFCSWLAYSRYQKGLPALLDFAAMSGMPATKTLPFIRPPFYHLPKWPGLWLAVNSLCGLAFGCWAMIRRKEPVLALLLAMFVPSFVSILVGQDSLILLAAATGVFLLLEMRRTLLAGLLLSLLWVKFQFLPAFVLLLLVRREWRAIAGFALGSIAILAPVAREIPDYLVSLQRVAQSTNVVPCRECMPNAYAFIPNVTAAVFVSVALLIVAAFFFRRDLPESFALALTTALLSSMHTHGYDCVFLFLAVVLAAWKSQPMKLLAGWTLSPLPYLLPYFGAMVRLLPALTATAVWLALILRAPDKSSAGPDEYRTA